jgi:hypothetical protein
MQKKFFVVHYVEEHPIGSSKQKNCKGKKKSANKRKKIETLG